MPLETSCHHAQSPDKLAARIWNGLTGQGQSHALKDSKVEGERTSEQAWCRRFVQSTLNLQWSYMCRSSWLSVSCRKVRRPRQYDALSTKAQRWRLTPMCFLSTSLSWQSKTPCSELNPPALVESQGAQWMLSPVVSQPDSFRCFRMKTTDGSAQVKQKRHASVGVRTRAKGS